jgi:hypothetical protein
METKTERAEDSTKAKVIIVVALADGKCSMLMCTVNICLIVIPFDSFS